jgi:hypothetical protein
MIDTIRMAKKKPTISELPVAPEGTTSHWATTLPGRQVGVGVGPTLLLSLLCRPIDQGVQYFIEVKALIPWL